MLPLLLQNLTSEWYDQLREDGVHLKPPISAMQLSGGRGKDRKVNFLVFNHNENRPVLIIKVARTLSYQERLTHEYQALRTVWKLVALQRSVPKPLGLFEVADNLVMIEQCLPGIPLTVLLRRHKRIKVRQVRHDLFKAQGWLKFLQAATRSGMDAFSGRMAIEERLQRLHHISAITLPSNFINRLLVMADSCQGMSLPLAGSHGDFWPGNFLVASDKVGVIDWEDFNYCAWPFNDLFQFIILYAQTYPWNGWRRDAKVATFRYAFLENNWFSKLVIEYITNHLKTMHLPDQFAHFFFSLFLLDRATPTAEQGAKRRQQAKIWQERLVWYAHNEKHSIFTT